MTDQHEHSGHDHAKSHAGHSHGEENLSDRQLIVAWQHSRRLLV